ncbi:MAG: molybdopterin biosynthesis protein [Proteobacteria bacterium]|nr:molybdopterin biosynthesis protein [Pseudomonadota bacterium]
MRKVYLNMKTRAEAREIWFSRFQDLNPGAEEIPSVEAAGRVLAAPVSARLSSPAFHAAAMDGVAIRATDTFGATKSQSKRLVVGESAFYVNTGHRMPPGTDAVIMMEHLRAGEDWVEFDAAAYPWQHVRKVGEDIVATQMLFPTGRLLTPACVGALLTGGVFSVSVRKQPRVLVLPTGDELTGWEEAAKSGLPDGRIIESNSHTLGGLVREAGGKWEPLPILPDRFPVIRDAVDRAAKSGCQMVLVLAGSSAGSEDHTARVLGDLGEVLVHGVTMMPGKPVVLGDVNGVPVLGVPGYPVSAMVAFQEFAGPLLRRMQGLPEAEARTVAVFPSRKIPSKLGLEDHVRVKLGRVGGRIVATPLPRGAGIITSVTEAHGVVRIGNESEGVGAGEEAVAELLVPAAEVEKTLVAVGSHDNSLDLLADGLAVRGLSLSSVHVGSMGGILAVKRGACHLAGTHLLDTTDGTYNLSYIARHLAGIPVRLVHLVMRDQGLLVPRGNPKDIQGVRDLAEKDVLFLNRQAGSGTRVLLDYRLDQEGVSPTDIRGYANEEYTHMAVAVAVKSGAADCGLGILAAARALDLDFVPVVTEQYDLIIREEHFGSDKIRALLSILADPEFKKAVQTLGGYHTERMGEILL